MIAMAIMGIAPVAAHAQSVGIEQLAELVGVTEQNSAPNQEQGQANLDEDSNTQNNFILATVGPFGTLTSTNTNLIEDSDSLTNAQEGAQTAPLTQTPAQTLTPAQIPTLTVADVLGLLPAGGQ